MKYEYAMSLMLTDVNPLQGKIVCMVAATEYLLRLIKLICLGNVPQNTNFIINFILHVGRWKNVSYVKNVLCELICLYCIELVIPYFEGDNPQ